MKLPVAKPKGPVLVDLTEFIVKYGGYAPRGRDFKIEIYDHDAVDAFVKAIERLTEIAEKHDGS